MEINFESNSYMYATETIDDKVKLTKEAIKKNEYLAGLIDNGIKSSLDAYNYMEGYFDGIMDALCINVDKDTKERDIVDINNKIREYDESKGFYGEPYLKKGMVVKDNNKGGIYYVYKSYRFTDRFGHIGDYNEAFMITSVRINILTTDISEYFLFDINDKRMCISLEDGGFGLTVNLGNYDEFKKTSEIIYTFSEEEQNHFESALNDYEEKMNRMYDIATSDK